MASANKKYRIDQIDTFTGEVLVSEMRDNFGEAKSLADSLVGQRKTAIVYDTSTNEEAYDAGLASSLRACS